MLGMEPLLLVMSTVGLLALAGSFWVGRITRELLKTRSANQCIPMKVRAAKRASKKTFVS